MIAPPPSESLPFVIVSPEIVTSIGALAVE